jgi:hypothetical protein
MPRVRFPKLSDTEIIAIDYSRSGSCPVLLLAPPPGGGDGEMGSASYGQDGGRSTDETTQTACVVLVLLVEITFGLAGVRVRRFGGYGGLFLFLRFRKRQRFELAVLLLDADDAL